MLRKLLVAFAVLVAVVLGSAETARAQCASGIGGTQPTMPAVSCTGAAAWNGSTAYPVNALVTYNNCLYKANQAVSANAAWAPGTPGLYLYGNGLACPAAGCSYGAQGPCGGSATATPTATSTATATTRATATSTSTARPTARPTSTATTRATATATTRSTARATATSTATPTATLMPRPSSTATPTATTAPRATATPTSSGGGGGNKGAYYADWDIYAGHNYFFPKAVHTSGQANNLNWINYAFGNVSNGSCVIGDSFADYDKAFTAAESVDGTADCWDAGCRRGLFHQMEELKAAHPGLKIIYSFGGWTWSGGFGAVAASPAAAAAFADNCYKLIHDARWNGTFDGIDIDWEYPNSCGLSCDASGANAYKTLMQALRTRFGSELVTSAITADGTTGGKIDAADYAGAAPYVNWFNLMTYDYFGGWAASGPTAPHSPLTSYTGIPTPGFYADAAVQKLKSKGMPASKMLLGIGLYGRGWTGVTQSAPGGSATGVGPCNGASPCEAGIEDYKVLASRCPATGTVAGTAYAYCNPQWWSYDTPATVASKMSYVMSQGLGGSFAWELSGDQGNALTSQLR